MLASLRVLVGSVMSFLVVMVLVLWFMLDDHTATPDVLWIAIVLAAGIGAAGLIHSAGFRTPSITATATTEESAQQARTAFQAGTTTRMVMAETPGIVALAVAFAAPEGGYGLYLLGAIISFALLALYALPTDAAIARTQRSLERGGGRVDLATALSSK